MECMPLSAGTTLALLLFGGLAFFFASFVTLSSARYTAPRRQLLETRAVRPGYGPAYDAEVAARARGGSVKNDDLSERRRAAVREAMRHSWQGYKKYAYGEDELEPITRTGSNAFGHLGATAIDAIDTLWLMGLEKEYLEARELVADFPKRMMEASPLSTFECTIRVLGGFMSTYYLTGDELYLNNARELGDRLLFAYSRKGLGMPSGSVSLNEGYESYWHVNEDFESHLLAEFGTTQLEFYALSKETGDMKYAKASAKPLEAVHGMYPNSSLLPTHFNNLGEIIPPMRYTMGAMADSYYEYLLKAWVQAGSHRDEMVHDTGRRWERSMEAMSRFLVYRYKGFTALQEVGGAFDEKVPNSHLGKISKSMDHLSCFVPGMLGLGVYKARDLMTSSQQVKFLKLAEDLTQTCYLFYHSTSTGLSGDAYSYHADKILPAGAQNLLRPETVESLMILYRATGNNKYREWGWEIFQAFEKHCKVEAGYCGVTDVTHPSAELDNKMQSWFLAETLKYLYLLFSPSDVLSLDEWVFNTEAHPMMIW